MKQGTKKSIVWVIVMTLMLVTINVMPIRASTLPSPLKVGDYIKYGTYQGEDILWYVIDENEKGLLLCQNELLKYRGYDGNKKSRINKLMDWLDEEDDLLDEENLFKGTVVAFYLNPNTVIFKVGEGTEQTPYTIYTEWTEKPTIKANGNKVVLSSVQLVGEQNVLKHTPTIEVDGIIQRFQNAIYDAKNKTITYELVNPIRQGQNVKFSYQLPSGAKSAIVKAGTHLVLKQLSNHVVINETIDAILQPVVITKPLQNEWIKVGENKTLSVKAKGEGILTFKWFKDNQYIFTEVKDSFNQEVSSSYQMGSVKVENAGVYRVEVSGTSGWQETAGTLNILNQYKVSSTTYPTRGGSITDNSALQDGVYHANDVATVTATPKRYYRFVKWTEDGKEVSRNRVYTFNVTQDRNLVAHFKWNEPEYIPQYTIYVTEVPEEGGTVRGDYTYNQGDYATLKATPKEGYSFESWTENGIVVSRDEEYSFKVEGERRLKANFEEDRSFKEKWRSLSSRQQNAIKDNFKEYLPYTTLDMTLSIEQLDELTKGYFDKKQLREVERDIELLEDVGIKLDWEFIKLKKVSNVNFKDVSRSHWAYGNIRELAKEGIVAGYPDQTFKPNKPLTVEDTFTFLDRVLLTNNEVEVKQPRSFVEKYIKDEKSWAFNHVASIGSKLSDQTLKTIGKMEGEYVSRELLAQVIYEVTNGGLKKVKPLVVFRDTLYSEYEEGIDYCVRTGLLEGTSAYTMEPEKPVTRAEMMTILQRLDNAIR